MANTAEQLTQAPAGAELTLIRIFEAPRALVWRMWAEAEHRAVWWRPKNFTNEEWTDEFRVGGAWRAVIRGPSGKDHVMRGIYREIVPEQRLVFTHHWLDETGESGPETLVTVTFGDSGQDGDRTRLTFHQALFETEGTRNSHEEGWWECLDSLAAHLAGYQA